MRVDGIRNYQQKPNFGAIQIVDEAYKKFKYSIDYILKEALNGNCKTYLGLDNSDVLSRYVPTDGRTKTQKNIIAAIKEIPSFPVKAIEPVHTNAIYTAMTKATKTMEKGIEEIMALIKEIKIHF